MSKMILEKDKQGMNRKFERTVDLLGDAFSNRETTHKIWKFKTCYDEADIDTDDNEPEGGPVTGNFTIDIFFLIIKKHISL